MTNVIAFKTPSRTGAPHERVDRSAEILFFMGVRYVRDEQQAALQDGTAQLSVAESAPAVVDERLQA